MAVFGGKPGEAMEYKGEYRVILLSIKNHLCLRNNSGGIGMAGNQVLEWYDVDSEIKTALQKNVRLDLFLSYSYIYTHQSPFRLQRTRWLLPTCESKAITSVGAKYNI